jgi:hypothetical protein
MSWKIPDRWACALSDAELNILSELNWKPLLNLGAQAGFFYSILHQRLVLRGDGQLGGILSGHLTDKEWEYSEWTVELSRSLSQSRGWTGVGQLMVGFEFPGSLLSWAPSVGVDGAVISLHQHGINRLFEVDYKRLQQLVNPGEMLNLFNSNVLEQLYPSWSESDQATYHVKWAGPLMALTLWLGNTSPISCELHGWYSLARYSAEADWCLQDVFQQPGNYWHHARLHTLQGQLSLKWQVIRSMALELQAGWRSTWSGNGKEVIYCSEPISCGAFDDLSWKRIWGTIALGYGF